MAADNVPGRVQIPDATPLESGPGEGGGDIGNTAPKGRPGVRANILIKVRYPLNSRQWPEEYDLCRTFLHVAQFRKHTAMRESHAKLAQRVQTCDKIWP